MADDSTFSPVASAEDIAAATADSLIEFGVATTLMAFSPKAQAAALLSDFRSMKRNLLVGAVSFVELKEARRIAELENNRAFVDIDLLTQGPFDGDKFELFRSLEKIAANSEKVLVDTRARSVAAGCNCIRLLPET